MMIASQFDFAVVEGEREQSAVLADREAADMAAAWGSGAASSVTNLESWLVAGAWVGAGAPDASDPVDVAACAESGPFAGRACVGWCAEQQTASLTVRLRYWTPPGADRQVLADTVASATSTVELPGRVGAVVPSGRAC